jgi:hypothetical protein
MSTAPESFAVAVVRQSFLEVPPSLSLTVVGQAFMGQKQRMRLSFWKTEVLEQCALKLDAEPAARTWGMYLKMPRKLLPVIATALIL